MAVVCFVCASFASAGETLLFDDFTKGFDTKTTWNVAGNPPACSNSAVHINPSAKQYGFRSQMQFSEPVSVEFKDVSLGNPKCPSDNNNLGFTPGCDKNMVCFRFVRGNLILTRYLEGVCPKDSEKSVGPIKGKYDLRIDWWPGKGVRYYVNGKIVGEYTTSVRKISAPIGVRDEKAKFSIGSIKVTRLTESVDAILAAEKAARQAKIDAVDNARKALIDPRIKAISEGFPKMRMVIGGPSYFWGIDAQIEHELKAAGMDVLAWPNAPLLDPEHNKVIGQDPMLYNVIIFGDTFYHLIQPDPNTGEIPARIRNQVPALKRFLEAGGGIWFCGLGEQNWGRSSHALNHILKKLNLGAEVVGEVVKDSLAVKGPAGHYPYYAWAKIMDDPLTNGVQNLLHPTGVISSEGSMGVCPIVKLSPKWRVLLKAHPTAASYPHDPTVHTGGSLLPNPGTVKSSPILCAVRKIGKGRVVLWPTWSCFNITGGSGGMLIDGESNGKTSDGARLIENLLCWLAEPSQNSKKVGTFDPATFKPRTKDKVDYAAEIKKWARPGRRDYPNEYKGLIGAHSNLSDGKNSPEEMIAAAKSAGYDFIAFTEDLARMDEAKWKRLLSACDKASAGDTLVSHVDSSWSSRMTFAEPVSVEFLGVSMNRHPKSGWNSLGLARGGLAKEIVAWAFDGSAEPARLTPRRCVKTGKDLWVQDVKKAVLLRDLPDLAGSKNTVNLRIDWWPGKKASYYVNDKITGTFNKNIPSGPLPVGVRNETVGFRIREIRVTSLSGKRRILFQQNFGKTPEFDTGNRWEAVHGKAPFVPASSDFAAYPGIDLMDEAGNRGLHFGQRYWIKDEWRSKQYPDRIKWFYNLAYGADANAGRWSPRVIIRSKTNNKRPWNQGLWNLFGAYCYEGGKLVDDSFHEWRRMVKRYAFFHNTGIVAVHTVRSPEEIAASARPGLYQTRIKADNLAQVLSRISGCVGPWPVGAFPTYISAGPEIQDFRLHFPLIHGHKLAVSMHDNDRGLLHVLVRAEAGLKEVSVYDGERLVRTFRPTGKKFETFITIHPDAYHCYSMTVTDKQGRQAVSWSAFMEIMEKEHRRCGDNWNWMATGKGAGSLKQPDFSYMLFEVTSGWQSKKWVPASERQKKKKLPRYGSEQGSYSAGGLSAAINGYKNPHAHLLVDGKAWPLAYPAMTLDFSTIGRYGVILTNTVRDELVMKKLVGLTIGAFAGPYKVVRCPWPGDLTQFVPMQKPDGASISRYKGEVKFIKDAIAPAGGKIIKIGQGSTGNPRATTLEIMHPDGTAIRHKAGKEPILGEIPEGGYMCWYDDKGAGLGGVIAISPGVHYSYNTARTYCFMELPSPVKAGTKVNWDVIFVTADGSTTNTNQPMLDIWQGMGIVGKPTLYDIQIRNGKILDQEYFLTLSAEDGGFSGKIVKTTARTLPIHLPVFIKGLNPRWDAAIWYRGDTHLHTVDHFRDQWGVKTWRWSVATYEPRTDELRYIPILKGGTGYCQVEVEKQDPDVFIGNPIVCDQADVFLTIIKAKKGRCEFEINNPTEKELTCTVRPAKGFTLVGRFKKQITVPPGGHKVVTVGAKR